MDRKCLDFDNFVWPNGTSGVKRTRFSTGARIALCGPATHRRTASGLNLTRGDSGFAPLPPLATPLSDDKETALFVYISYYSTLINNLIAMYTILNIFQYSIYSNIVEYIFQYSIVYIPI